MNSDKVVEITAYLSQEDAAAWVSNLWDTWNNQRQKKLNQYQELKEFLFATDTTTTSVGKLPWSNTTTTPKLCQIRDNLHSNYLAAIFPNDKWLQWQAYTKEDASRQKAATIRAYMENKTREGNFRNVISQLLLDYIDYGNAFAMASFDTRYNTMQDGAIVPSFIGPTAERISPEDIVFNPLATSFQRSPKIVRSVKTIGEVKRLAQTNPNYAFWNKILERREVIRGRYGGYKTEDFTKASQYSIDGFGNLYEYYMSNYIEILEFYGDYYDSETQELKVNQVITIADRSVVAREAPIETWSGEAPIYHAGWRKRPDNLWAMGPLDNLVGMQYRIDHLENLKADAMDLIVFPPLLIKGEVEEFEWAPRAEIHVDENGDVGEVSRSLSGIVAADNQIEVLEARMEMYAGAPREAMGIRTPGEKTAFEVQQLNTAAGRIFQEKATSFEIELLEKLLNGMLEQAVRNFDNVDVVRVLDTDLGVTQFRQITVDDITARGILRPVGARHFAQQAQDLQNLIGVAGSPLWPLVAPHTSGKGVTRFVEDITSLSGYALFKDNIAVFEQQETQRLMQQTQEDLEVEATGPSEADVPMMEDAGEEVETEGGQFENISY